MRILHVSTATSWRGGENQILNLLTHLKSAIDQFVYCPDNSPLHERVHPLSIPCIVYQKRSGLSMKSAFQIKSICQKEKIDLIHVHDSHAHNYAYLSGLLGNPVSIIVTRRVDFVPGRLALMKYNYSKVTKVISVSQHIQNILAKRGVKKHKLKTIYSGINKPSELNTAELKKEWGWSNEVKVVGYIGAMVDHKNPMAFLKIAKNIISERGDIRFVMCGQSGELSEDVNRFISTNGLTSSIKHLGFQSDLNPIWKSLDVLLITSKMEGLGTVALEAMARKVPVISSNAGGLKEMIVDNDNGFLCDVDDLPLFQKKTLELLTDEKKRLQFIESGKRRVKMFNVKKMAEEYQSVYLECLK